ncbi:MAG: hypothetical protein COB30_020370 [Ectothiorhodospiraceae bacterium]|nr:hypothetical protein [Ectothiorhodospiraceae bacterium]
MQKSAVQKTDVNTIDIAQVIAIKPTVLQQGKAASVKLKWVPGKQLALMSAGPYITHRLPLHSSPVAMASNAQWAYLVTDDQRLLVVDFPELTSDARIVGQLALGSSVAQLYYANHQANHHLLAVLDDGRMLWLDVTKPHAPVVLSTLASVGKVLDVQLDYRQKKEQDSQKKERNGYVAHVLIEAGMGRSILQQWWFDDPLEMIDDEPQFVARWILPVEASAIAVRHQNVWAVLDDGIAVLDIRHEQAVVNDRQRTSGTPQDVQLAGELALISDGRGGLVLFDVSRPEQLQWRGSFNKRGAISGFSLNANVAKDESVLLHLAAGNVLRMGIANPELPSSGAVFSAGAPVMFSALQGDVALLATPRGLQRVMMIGGGDGAISPEGLNLGGSRRGAFGLEGQEDILYVADWFSGLHLYDISNPRQLRHISNYHTPGSSKGVTLLGNYALVGDDDQGLQIINIENPRKPKWTAELPPEAMAGLGLAYTMKLVDKTLFLADHRGGFHIIDLSDIKRPRRLGGYDTPGKAWDIDVENNVAFVADDRGGLLMFDVSDPTQPEPFAQFDPKGQAEAVALQDGRAYVAFFDKGLYTLDVSNPRQSSIIGHTPIPGNARGIELGDGLLYVASWEAGLQIVDTRGPVVPQIIGSFDTDGAAWGVKVKGGYAYVLDWWGGIKIVDVREPSRPTYVSRYHASGTLQQLLSKDTYLYAASGEGGVQVYDIKNPLNPIWVTGLDTQGSSQHLWIEDERLYVAEGDAGVAVFDILDPFYTTQIGAIPTPGEATNVVAVNEYLYIADDQAGLLVMDMRDPQQPVEVARYNVQVRDMWLDEDTLWLATDNGLLGQRVADNGLLSQHVKLPGRFNLVRVQGELLVASISSAAGVSGNIHLWRLSDTGPVKFGQLNNDEAIASLQLDEHKLYVLGLQNGLKMFDISQPGTPQLRAVYPATGHHSSVTIARGAAFFAGQATLASVTLLPAVTVGTDSSGAWTLQVPDDLPLGKYHLQTLGVNGQRQIMPNALKVQYGAPGKPTFSLDAFRRLMKSPLKPPAEVDTEISIGH